MKYKREWIEQLAREYTQVIVELYTGECLVGYLAKSTYDSKYFCILHFDNSRPRTSFNLSNIKRMIYLSNNHVLPVELHGTHRMTKTLDVFEMNELLNKAGYQQC